MADQKKFIFVSSSSDMADSRKKIANELQSWLSGHGLSRDIAPYLWEEQTDAGRMLIDRMPIQPQLLDPFETFSKVPFVICIFGERCGVPLEDNINSDWERRILPWRADTTGRGLIHPWPKNAVDQDSALDKGGFPLTGTVFELLSACEAEPDLDNLVIGYVANRAVDYRTTANNIFFNTKKERTRLLKDARNPAEENKIRDENYLPQIRALINLLVFFGEHYSPARFFATETDLVDDILKRAKIKLSDRLKLACSRNPFKTTLEHWTINDELRLPGRDDKARQILDAVEAHKTHVPSILILIKGSSGCGKSSLLHRGVLATLSDRGSIVVPLRPTDLSGVDSGENLLDMLWMRICERVGISYKEGKPPTSHKRDEWMASTVIKILETNNAHLVIGLDQFEEVLDDLSLFKAKHYRTKRWWLIMRFLGRLASCRRMQLIATLETSRWKSFEALKIESELNLQRMTVDVDVSADDAARIAQAGFSSAGIHLEVDILEEIKTQWDKLKEQQSRHGQSASPLPLACLRFAKLFEKFSDLAHVESAVRADAASLSFATASEGTRLSLEQIGGVDAIKFDDLIASLADQAWSISVAKKINGWPIENDPDLCNTLSNFLDPLVGLDSEGHLRLLAVAHNGADDTSNKLRANFRRARLLVPARQESVCAGTDNGTSLLRLVHQAVIDRWEPARRWFEWRKKHLAIEANMRQRAKAWAMGSRRYVHASTARVQQASLILSRNIINWSLSSYSESEGDGHLRDYCLMLFKQASDPRELIEGHLFGRTFAHLASAYQMTDLLDKFWETDPSFVNLRNKSGNDLFFSATWHDGASIPWLISKQVVPVRDKAGWHPIVGAIQIHANANYEHLVADIPTLTEPVGPSGETMLGLAAYYGNTHVVQDLLKKGCDPESPDDNGISALMYAAMRNRTDVFRILLPLAHIEAATNNDSLRYSALHYATQNGNAEIIQALLNDSRIDEFTRENALVQKDGSDRTPLAIAAMYGHTESVQVLLSVCDPRDRIHRNDNDDTLFHQAVSGWKPHEEERLRAKRVVEVLLEDGRLDPTISNKQGRTAFECASDYPEARRVLRQYMPIRYADLTDKMRQADLRSNDPADALRLIREAPNALTDLHDGMSGLDILLQGKKVKVLSVVLQEYLITAEMLHEKLSSLADLAADKWANELNRILVDRLHALGSKVPELPVLLNTAIRNQDDHAIQQLVELGTTTVKGSDRVGASVFHTMAIQGEVDEFRQVSGKFQLSLPVDNIGQRPSDLAAENDAEELRAIETQCFKPAVPQPIRWSGSSKFHDHARRNDLKAFERLARDARIAVPLDEMGRKPSDVASEKSRMQFAALEAKYFLQTPGSFFQTDEVSAPYLVLEEDTQAVVDKPERQRILLRVRSVDKLQLPNARTTTVRRLTLPFYADVDLIELQNPCWGNRATRLCFLDHANSLFRLNGESTPIHTVNRQANLRIIEPNVLQYLAFFCFFTRGEEGPFLIVDRTENSFLPSGIDLATLNKCFRPAKILGQDHNGDWRVSALVYYADAIFFADFLVQLNGMIEMLADWPVVAKLGFKIDAPLSVQRGPGNIG